LDNTFIIAEIGLNHNGNLKTAKTLVAAAVHAGADAVKFQTYWSIPECEKYNFTKKQWGELFGHCGDWGIEWFSTPFDMEAVRFLDQLGMTRWKIPSNRIVVGNAYLLKGIAQARNREHTIISTGISNDREIGELIRYFKNKPYAILHCVSLYPTPIEKADLNRIAHLKAMFQCTVGFSDHSANWRLPLRAVKMGAEIIECHLTLDKDAEGPDHKASLTPSEFKKMVKSIRRGA
jgi:N,N'-diacetyllegionaminate synthase